MSFPGGSEGKASACNAGDPGSIPGSGRSTGEGNGNPLSTLAWKIPWTEELGGLQSMGSQRVRHNWATSLEKYVFRSSGEGPLLNDLRQLPVLPLPVDDTRGSWFCLHLGEHSVHLWGIPHAQLHCPSSAAASVPSLLGTLWLVEDRIHGQCR